MVKTKKMNESVLAAILKSLNVAGELVRSRQEEKQSLLDEFDETSKRFFFGKISERTLASSVKKTNKELKRLNGDIRKNISNLRAASVRASALASKQAPLGFRATLSGISKEEKKKKRKKKVVKRKATKKVSRKKVRSSRKKKTIKRRTKKRR